MDAVTKVTGMSRATIYRKIKAGTFPLARQLGANSVGWLEREIAEWIEKRPVVQI
jgi:prophage regulatory protein